jgi:hypothetical protein
MRILYVGDDWVGSNARSLADGFRQAGHDVVVVDTTAVTLPPRLSPSWVYTKFRGQRAPRDVESAHRQIESIAASFRPDLLFCFRTIHLDQSRLLTTPAGMHVHYSPDDVSNPCNTTGPYLANENRWDLVVTTKRHNVSELLARGARRVQFVFSAYDPAWHKPSARRDPRNFLLGFIGNCRSDRRDITVRLARCYGERMLIRGPGWRRVPELRRSHAVVDGPVYGEHFSAAVASIRANLVFLNSDNRDTHTCRTFEIPAAGGLFVGQRTSEHQELLAEGHECLLFSDEDELTEILRWCDLNPDRAREIAEAGLRRIVTGRHRYVDRAREIVDTLDNGFGDRPGPSQSMRSAPSEYIAKGGAL